METKPYPFREVWIRLEEGRTLYSEEKIEAASQAVEVMEREMSRYDREVVCIVNLNNLNQPINFNIVSMGTLCSSLVDVANVLKSCILSNAASFIMLHNHPSGEVTPSGPDMEVTRRLILSGNLMGIPLLDHIIIAGGRKESYSMRENGDMNFTPEYDQVIKGTADMVAQESGVYETPFGNISKGEIEAAIVGAEKSQRQEEITIKFGKGLCEFFTSKKGTELARIKIPKTPFESWPSFVVPGRFVHDNQYGKGCWIKLPAEGKTILTISRKATREDGRQEWEKKRIPVGNRQLKEMVEAYKKDTPDRSGPGEIPDFKPRERGR